MRIAISGSHATGKSTLLGELARRLPSFETIEEAYYLLADDGHVFSDPPQAEDYALMFDRSVAAIGGTSAANQLFDRCPADYLAYTAASRSRDSSALSRMTETAIATLRQLDLVVFVPIEEPDRIHDAAIALPKLQRRVDTVLREMLLDDQWGFRVQVLEVQGTLEARAEQVCASVMSDSVQRSRSGCKVASPLQGSQ